MARVPGVTTCEPKTPPLDLKARIRRLDFVGLVVFILLCASASFILIKGTIVLAGGSW